MYIYTYLYIYIYIYICISIYEYYMIIPQPGGHYGHLSYKEVHIYEDEVRVNMDLRVG